MDKSNVSFFEPLPYLTSTLEKNYDNNTEIILLFCLLQQYILFELRGKAMKKKMKNKTNLLKQQVLKLFIQAKVSKTFFVRHHDNKLQAAL